MDVNAAQTEHLVQCLCIENDAQFGRNTPISYSNNQCSNDSEDLGMEEAAAGIRTRRPVKVNEIAIHIDIDSGSCWL
jgi:hypothetical protein